MGRIIFKIKTCNRGLFFVIYSTLILFFTFYHSSYAMNDTYGEIEYDNTTHNIRCICKYTESSTLTNHDTTWDGWQSGIVITLVTSCLTVIATDLLQCDDSKIWKYVLQPCPPNTQKYCLKPCGACLKTTFDCCIDSCGSCLEKTVECCTRCCCCHNNAEENAE